MEKDVLENFANFVGKHFVGVSDPQARYLAMMQYDAYPSRPNPGRRENTKLSFYFNTALWCLKRFYEGLTGLHKTF